MSECNVSIDGMHCKNCVYKIESELGDVEGILEAKVDLENKSGKFKYDSASKVTPDSIVKTIKDLGFTAKLA